RSRLHARGRLSEAGDVDPLGRALAEHHPLAHETEAQALVGLSQALLTWRMWVEQREVIRFVSAALAFALGRSCRSYRSQREDRLRTARRYRRQTSVYPSWRLLCVAISKSSAAMFLT